MGAPKLTWAGASHLSAPTDEEAFTTSHSSLLRVSFLKAVSCQMYLLLWINNEFEEAVTCDLTARHMDPTAPPSGCTNSSSNKNTTRVHIFASLLFKFQKSSSFMLLPWLHFYPFLSAYISRVKEMLMTAVWKINHADNSSELLFVLRYGLKYFY